MISRICESFRCRPQQAKRELRRNPDLVFRILELRHYASALEAVKRAEKDTDLPPEGADPIVDLAFELYATGGKGLS